MISTVRHYEQTPISRGTKYVLMSGAKRLSFIEAIELLIRDFDFRDELTTVLAASSYAAFRWETPPLTIDLFERPFEFVIIDSPGLAPRPEPEAFEGYFAEQPADVDVLAIPNLGKTATLVVPRKLAEPQNYSQLARFVRGAPREQIHHLWQCAATTVKANVSQRPLWLSTAGGGVSWLHVRIDSVPKYYAYRPYADGA